MPLEQFIALTTFAVVGSFTPGPNNTIATVTGVNHGFRAALPHIAGVPFGFATMLTAGSLGVAALLLATPMLAAAVKWAGIAYLLFIAWQIMRAGSLGDSTVARPMTFWQSAAFQYANPKAWMLAAATAGSFTAGDATTIAIIVAVFGVTAAASLITWASIGAALRGWLTVGKRLRVFNLTMGVLLAATAIWLAFQ
jgi:threonine/homoserine/homoserine lactone efflux protein